MAKKWPGFRRVNEATVAQEEDPEIVGGLEEENEEIDVVGIEALATGKNLITATYWDSPSPKSGTTAPHSPHSPEATKGSTMLYNGKFHCFRACFFFFF
jgi:hypothetical protein